MKKKELYQNIINYFEQTMPSPETELNYSNPFQLLIAVVLSAQCTDKRVNLVTPKLFADFPTPNDLGSTTFEILFPYIKSISYPQNKTKHLIGLGKMLTDDFNSEIPNDIELLQKLPGVGRKTANVIASVIFNQATMAVDTHVFRVSRRMGLVDMKDKTPLLVEKKLVKYIPDVIIPKAHHWLILHGRYTCVARTPKCEECGISEFCKYYQNKNKTKKIKSQENLDS
ncbi:MAG: endonuclease III [Bacteroidetes bacterium]|nr:MAG: endonuclease III [Bacteroidota bacterium]